MIFKQGATYKGEAPEAVEESTAPSKLLTLKIKGIPLPAIVVGGCILLVLLLMILLPAGDSTEVPDTSPSPVTSTVPDDYWDDFVLEATFEYSSAEVAELRAWGYTADEIEANELLKTPASTLIAASKQAQEEALATLADPESPEYQELLNSTWLGEPDLDLSAYTPDVANQLIYTNHVINADYEKVAPHGHTLYLKVYLEDGSAVFMECSLPRYLSLADSGNIVVRYQTATVDDIVIIHDMEEVAIS